MTKNIKERSCNEHEHDHENCDCHDHDHDHSHNHGQPYINEEGTYISAPQFFVNGDTRIGVYSIREGLDTILPLIPEDEDAEGSVDRWDLFISVVSGESSVALGVADFHTAIAELKKHGQILDKEKIFVKAMTKDSLVALMEACNK